jgi:hypothetical protein
MQYFLYNVGMKMKVFFYGYVMPVAVTGLKHGNFGVPSVTGRVARKAWVTALGE